MAVSVTAIKIVVIIIMFLLVFAVCATPIYVLMRMRSADEAENFSVHSAEDRRRRKTREKWVSRLSVFSAGVFVSIGLMDLFPDANGDLKEAVEVYKWKMPDFPLSYFLMLCGFFVVLVLEQVALYFKEASMKRERDLARQKAELQESQPLLGNGYRKESGISSTPRLPGSASPAHPISYTESYVNSHSVAESRNRTESSTRVLVNGFPVYGSTGNLSIRRVQSLSDLNIPPESYFETLEVPSIVGIRNQPVFTASPDSEENLLDADAIEQELMHNSGGSSVRSTSHHHCMHRQDSQPGHNDSVVSKSNVRTILLVLAMTVHSLFEGISLGLMENLEAAVSFFIAIIIHKTIVAFSIGMQLGSSSLTRCTILVCVLIFSLMSPFGATIGLLVVRFVSASPSTLVSGILQSITSGTFLYVAFFEVLPHEFNNGRDRLGKLSGLIVGFIIVTIYVLIDKLNA